MKKIKAWCSPSSDRSWILTWSPTCHQWPGRTKLVVCQSLLWVIGVGQDIIGLWERCRNVDNESARRLYQAMRCYYDPDRVTMVRSLEVYARTIWQKYDAKVERFCRTCSLTSWKNSAASHSDHRKSICPALRAEPGLPLVAPFFSSQLESLSTISVP